MAPVVPLTKHHEPVVPLQLASVQRIPAAQRVYLCQYEIGLADDGRLTTRLPLRHFAESPGQAMRWLRRAVRLLAPSLDPKAEQLAADWLDDTPGYRAAVLALGCGEAFLLALPSTGLLLQIEARPVVLLTVMAPTAS